MSKPNDHSTEDTTTGVTYDRFYCSLQPVPEPVFTPEVLGNPERFIRLVDNSNKWVNGTTLHYYFFDEPTDGRNLQFTDGTVHFRSWLGNDTQKNFVRQAFQVWMAVGIGLDFKEVTSRQEAEIRIGFEQGDGSWSYIGRDILTHGPDERTMNFGWDLTLERRPADTPTHEIGHTLGAPHEHQNPNSGIVWNEEAVYGALAKPPNSWNREKTFFNIIRKLDPSTVEGSKWDPNSIMHYPFAKGLIKEPTRYSDGLTPAGGISALDNDWVRKFYPVLTDGDHAELKALKSVPLDAEAGQQRNFVIQPEATRYYEFRTFGKSDAVMVLFEDGSGETRYLTADDDSGKERNAYVKVKLFKGHRYILRVRLCYKEAHNVAVMMW